MALGYSYQMSWSNPSLGLISYLVVNPVLENDPIAKELGLTVTRWKSSLIFCHPLDQE